MESLQDDQMRTAHEPNIPDEILSASQQVTEQFFAAVDRIEDKAFQIIQSMGVVIALTGLVRPFKAPLAVVAIYLLFLLAAVFTVIMALRVIWVATYTTLPAPNKLREYMQDCIKRGVGKEDEQQWVSNMLIDKYQQAFESAKERMTEKARWLRVSQWSMLITLTFLALWLFANWLLSSGLWEKLFCSTSG